MRSSQRSTALTDVAVYMVTHDNPDETLRVIDALRKTSDCDFDLFVVDSGSGPVMQQALSKAHIEGKIDWLLLSDENIGQNLGANAALDEIYSRHAHDWVVCWSPDVLPKGRRVLKKLIRAARMFQLAGAKVVLAPKVLSGIKANQLTATGDDIGVPYHTVLGLKGYVRVHPKDFFRNYRFIPFGALAYGESLEVADHANLEGYTFVVVENIKVRHVGDEPGLIERHVSYGL